MKFVESSIDLLVIGIGNRMRGDDGAGVQAAEMLSSRTHAKQVRVLTVHQLLPEHAEEIARARRVLFLDASVEVASGRLKCCRVMPEAGDAPLSHHVTAGQLLLLANQLYGTSPECWLIQIGGNSFEVRSRLSRNLQHPVRRLVEELAKQMQMWSDDDA